MSVELNPITSGYSTGLINDNFQLVEDELNSSVLRRDGLSTGEPNQMEVNLDMNGYDILNIGSISSASGSPFLTEEGGDGRYVNVSGDTMTGSLNMGVYPITVRIPEQSAEPVRKDQFDSEVSNRQSADANLQSQISGGTPLEASAFSEISWHGQTVENSVTIPDNQNAWSIGPTMSIAAGQSVTVGTGSNWTIVEGNLA